MPEELRQHAWVASSDACLQPSIEESPQRKEETAKTLGELSNVSSNLYSSRSSKKAVLPEPEGVSWQWEHKTGFRDYRPTDNARIEFAYKRGDPKVRVKTGKQGSSPMEIFFGDMVQYDAQSGNCRRVRRLGNNSLFVRAQRFCMEFVRSWETGQPRKQTYDKYKARQKALVGGDSSLDVTQLYNHGYCARIAASSAFFAFSMFLVFLNVIWIGIDVDLGDYTKLSDAPAEFQVMEYIFCICFTIELLIRFAAFKKKCDARKDSWFCYDAALVFFMFLETLFLPFMELLFGDGDSNPIFRNAEVLRGARLLKLARMTRLLRALPELMTMLRGIVTAFRSVVFTLVMQVLFLYTFGVIFTTWTAAYELEPLYGYFIPLSRSVYSLLVHGTFMDEPSSPLALMIEVESPTMVTLFMLFIILSSFTVLNLLVGILFQVVADVSAMEKSKTERDFLKFSLIDILECYDKKGDRTLGKEEFEVLMKNPEVHDVLLKFGTDVQDLETLTDVLFQESEELGTCTLSFDEILQVVLRLRGEHAAHVTDVVQLRGYLRQRTEELRKELSCGQEELSKALESLDAAQEEADGDPLLVLLLTMPDDSERRQLRRRGTTILELLQHLSPRPGTFLALNPAGLEVGPELTLGQLIDQETGDVRLQLVQAEPAAQQVTAEVS